MLRIVPALLIALSCHLLLFFLPLPQYPTAPRPTGIKSMEIQLQSVKNNKPQPEEETSAAPEAVVKTITRRQPLIPGQNSIAVPTEALVLKRTRQKKRFSTPISHAAVPQKKETGSPPDHNRQSSPIQPSVAVIKAIPLYQQNPKPEYPVLARRRNWQGTVILAVIVSKKGKGQSVKIHRSSGYTILDKSALQTVQSWHFIPGKKEGKAIEMEVLVPVHFRLDE